MTLKQIGLFGAAVSATKNVDSIRMINAVSYPHMKKEGQKALMKSLTGEHDKNMIQL